MAMEATYYSQRGHTIYWDTHCDVSPDRIISKPEGLPFCDLPSPDRHLTKAFNPKYQRNGNFKYLPGTYIQSARDCWYGKCTFCQWSKLYPNYEVRPPEVMAKEIYDCYKMGFREVFDDSGTFPSGEWTKQLIGEMDNVFPRGKRKDDIRISCNLRFGTYAPYELMFNKGFRMILYGLESANQKTLDRIKKGINVNMAIKELKEASRIGLEPHIAVMFGYPWETEKDALNTLKLVWYLLKHGYAKTAQASVYTVPDMFPAIGKKKYVKMIYRIGYRSPIFWYNKIKDIKDIDSLKYLLRGIKEGLRKGA